MPKRMIDTDLWNDDDIIADFTAEDKYFWLYLLTNPHNNICGVSKYRPSLIARDMGFHPDTITNLVYRFEQVYNKLYLDKNTNEMIILNWSKYNWTKSEDFLKTIEKKLTEVKSVPIRNILIEKINEKLGKTVLRPSQEGTNTNPNTNSINIIDEQDIIYMKIIELYNSICNRFPKVEYLTEQRKQVLCELLKKYNVEDFEKCFTKARKSTFLGASLVGWKPTFDWLIVENNMVKVLEGNFDDGGSFDTDEFFQEALKRSYGK